MIRDNEDHIVEFKSGNECEVKVGIWVDPYTGETINDAREIDIDHFVHLKNAHEFGA